jgi:hypothetical protein
MLKLSKVVELDTLHSTLPLTFAEKQTVRKLRKTKSHSTKRYIAIFSDGDMTIFGLKNPKNGNFLDHHDKKRKQDYLNRAKNHLKTLDFKKAGYLSIFIAWNKKTITSSIKDFNSRISKNDFTLPY